MRDDPGELGAHGDEEGLLAFVELAALLLLHHQHPITRLWWMIGAPRNDA